jgi:carbonic anhydrase
MILAAFPAILRVLHGDVSDGGEPSRGNRILSNPAGIRKRLTRAGALSLGRRMLDHLKANNRAWAAAKVSADAGFFKRLEGQQAPEYLWIGCSDSRVPANEIVGLDPGELFVHRNVANLAPPQDANYLSVLQFAVDVIKVKHIMVVGHYGCGGVAAAVDGRRRGLVDHWLHPIREVFSENRQALEAIPDQRLRLDRLCELNVMRQVRNVASDIFVQDAWARGQEITVHGWVYSLANGLVTDLSVTIGHPAGR